MNDRTCIRSYVNQEVIDTLRQEVAGRDELSPLADIFALLGDLTRLRILYALTQAAELCVCDLADILAMDVSAVSHQLRRLKDRNLVQRRREGLTIYYSLTENEFVQEACQLLDTLLAPPLLAD